MTTLQPETSAEIQAMGDCPPGPHTHPVEEAAPRIGCSARTLRDRCQPRARNRLEHTRAGREIRFTDEQIAQAIAAFAVRPAPPRRDSRRRS